MFRTQRGLDKRLSGYRANQLMSTSNPMYLKRIATMPISVGYSGKIAISADGTRGYTYGTTEGCGIYVLNLVTYEVTRIAPTGRWIIGDVKLSADGSYAVFPEVSDAAHLVRTSDNLQTMVNTRSAGSQPYTIACNSNASTLYVPCLNTAVLSVIDVASNTATLVPSNNGYRAQGCSITPNGQFLYTAGYYGSAITRLSDNTIVASTYPGRNGKNWIEPTGTYMYSIPYTQNAGGFSKYRLSDSSLVYDTSFWVSLRHYTYDFVVDPTETYAYVATSRIEQPTACILKVDIANGTYTTIKTPSSGIYGIAISPDGTKLYCSESSPAQVSVYDLRSITRRPL